MIRYRLVCKDGHEFEGWFANSAAYDTQACHCHIACPSCGSTSVGKAIMAPGVASGTRENPTPPGDSDRAGVGAIEHLTEMVRQLRDEVCRHAEYVGPKFAEEARRIHFAESPARGIYGEATRHEVEGLREDGITVFHFPRLPEDQN